MPDIRNTFIRSKMNKDLDARIVPAGEYRDAVNVTVSTSEGADVGALENILGTKLLNKFNITAIGTEVIGVKEDPGTNRLFAFFTNYNDSSSDRLSNFAPSASYCSIICYDITSNTVTPLVSGNFLNFSKTHPIFGINILEELLFWTDDRNQPRKININSALASPATAVNPYYQLEDQISVAKYYPFDTPEVYSEEVIDVQILNGGIGNQYPGGFPDSALAPPFANTQTANSTQQLAAVKYPQTAVNSFCKITSGTPLLKLYPGLAFTLVPGSAVGTGNSAGKQPVAFKSSWPYFNCIRNWETQPYVDTQPPVAPLGPFTKSEAVSPNTNPDVFYPNTPFYYIDDATGSSTNGSPLPWEGTCKLKIIQQSSSDALERYSPATYRLKFAGVGGQPSGAGSTTFLQSQGKVRETQPTENKAFPFPTGVYPQFEDYTNSIGFGYINLTITDINGYGLGQKGAGTSGASYNAKVDYLKAYLQPDMKISSAAFPEDGTTYLVDQIFPQGTDSSSNTVFSITVKKIDQDGNYIPSWVWPEFTFGDPFDFSFKNPWFEENFGGDKFYLEDKFVRLAYRFTFDDGETSLISPFTQSLFEPLQKGYYIYNEAYAAFNANSGAFLGQGTVPSSDVETVGTSTLNFLYQNVLNTINLSINMPYVNGAQIQVQDLSPKLKVKSIDIIYEDSESTALRLLKTIPITDSSINGNALNYYVFKWQGDKPFKTLPATEVTRVSDQVPIRALAQESAGNRIIYGNFLNRHSSPDSLDFSVGSGPKYDVENEFSSNSSVEYPNHTLKQNRNYQVGVVLSDKFGRQSDVILAPPIFSTNLASNGDVFSGDTFFHNYKRQDQISAPISDGSNIVNWVGDSLKILFKNKIPSTLPNVEGYPGLYNKDTNPLGWYSYKVVVKQQQQGYYNLYMPFQANGEPLLPIGVPTGPNGIAPNTNVLTSFTLIGDNINKITTELVETNSQLEFNSSEDKLYPRVATFGELIWNTSNWVDTGSVGYQTGMVNLNDAYDNTVYIGNIDQIYSTTGRSAAGVSIAEVNKTLLYKQPDNSYAVIAENEIGRNPFVYYDKITGFSSGVPTQEAPIINIGKEITNTGIGITSKAQQNNIGGIDANSISIVEVEADESKLEIFWESSTSGLISELNTLIENNIDENIPAALNIITVDFFEDNPVSLYYSYYEAGLNSPSPLVPTTGIDPYIISVQPKNAVGDTIPFSAINSVEFTCVNADGTDVKDLFVLSNINNPAQAIYKIYLKQTPQCFLQDVNTRQFTFSFTFNIDAELPGESATVTTLSIPTISLQNVKPKIRNPGNKNGLVNVTAGTGGTVWGDDGVNGSGSILSPSYNNGGYDWFLTSVTATPPIGSPIENAQDIAWSVVSCIETTTGNDIASDISFGYTGGNIVNDNAGLTYDNYVNENYIVASATASAGTYNLIYQVTDANGAGLSFEYPTETSFANLNFTINP